MKFVEFLRVSKERIQTIKRGILVHLVLGNESCDLDSMVSAMVLAYHYSMLEKYNHILVIPMMNKPQDFFPIRVENLYLLDKYGIPLDSLIFSNSRDTIPLDTLQKQYKLTVSLVDHHVLPPAYKFLKESVTEVIDHRPIDESEVWAKAVYKDIQPVGSCATLISTHINHEKMTPIVFEMLYDVITYDTIAFSEKAGKVKPLDLKIATILEKELSIEHDTIEERFDEIYNAHKNISKLTTEQLLYKDLKVVANILVPGLPMLVFAFLQRQDVEAALVKFSRDNHAHTVLIMGLEVVGGQLSRDLAVYTDSDIDGTRIEEILLARFQVEKMTVKTGLSLPYYRQKNATLSRKQLIPLIQEALHMEDL